jgi:WD40 repeat protein
MTLCPVLTLQFGLPTYELTNRDKDFVTENPTQSRTAAEDLAVNWDVRCEETGGGSSSVDTGGTAGTAGTANTAGTVGTAKSAGSQVRAATTAEAGGAESGDPKKTEQWRSAVALLTPVEFSGAQLSKVSPNCSILPEWVYGYQAEHSKCNLHYTSAGDIVYHISKYAVVYSIKHHQQRIFTGHNEEILCLKMHPSKQIVATGEIGDVPKLLVWHAESHKILYSAAGFHQKGVTQLCFSPDGRILVSVGNDAQQSISVCLWEEGTVLFNSPVSTVPALCLSCTVLRDNTIVAAGDSYVHFWSYYSEGYVRRVGNFSRFTALQPITALAPVCDSDNLVSGTASGLLLLWVDVNCIRSVKGHNGTINAIFSCSHGILSGGFDQRIRMWSTTLEPSFTFDVSHYGINPIVRSLCMSTDGTSILLGTKGANIFEISAIDGSDLRGGPIAIGHSYASVLSVATHPSKFEFTTVGQDQTLRVFDLSTRTQLKIATFDGEASAVAYNPMGDILVVGFSGAPGAPKTGAFVVLNEEDLSVVHEAKDSASSVTMLAFSPEGETLAVGCADGGIYLYAVHDDYELVGKCDRHETTVTEIDFSKDGEWLRSNSVAGELFFFNTDDASFQSNVASMRDVVWATSNCTYSWHVKEVHRSPYEADQLVRLNLLPIPEELVGTTEPYLAGATALGYVRLYRYPCVVDGAECHRYPAHCGDISGIRFSFDGQRLVTAGRTDRCVLQWRCLPYAADTEQVAPEETAADDHDLKLEALTGPLLLDSFMPEHANTSVGLLNEPFYKVCAYSCYTPSH